MKNSYELPQVILVFIAFWVKKRDRFPEGGQALHNTLLSAQRRTVWRWQQDHSGDCASLVHCAQQLAQSHIQSWESDWYRKRSAQGHLLGLKAPSQYPFWCELWLLVHFVVFIWCSSLLKTPSEMKLSWKRTVFSTSIWTPDSVHRAGSPSRNRFLSPVHISERSAISLMGTARHTVTVRYTVFLLFDQCMKLKRAQFLV